ncbi:hypothetical protein HK100_007593 [Physocladia obscura]|uniref:protein-serine/threonine phosphatase n=1 Tax=Physocladia obscura TaxID=109957 RepID=A0AAD5SQF7_9FUNG|nr:hypothetical protein HK100_007593 [Physocladia obscura]
MGNTPSSTPAQTPQLPDESDSSNNNNSNSNNNPNGNSNTNINSSSSGLGLGGIGSGGLFTHQLGQGAQGQGQGLGERRKSQFDRNLLSPTISNTRSSSNETTASVPGTNSSTSTGASTGTYETTAGASDGYNENDGIEMRAKENGILAASPPTNDNNNQQTTPNNGNNNSNSNSNRPAAASQNSNLNPRPILVMPSGAGAPLSAPSSASTSGLTPNATAVNTSASPTPPPVGFSLINSFTARVSSATSTSASSYTSNNAPLPQSFDIDACIARLLEARSRKASKAFCLKNSTIVALCQRLRDVLMDQPILLEIEAPVNLVGDVHGQFEDLLRIFDKCGYPPNANYLFLGDYVDRGKFSLETILLLMDYIRAIPRPSEVPEFGLLNDLLWSDPSATAIEWEDNDRGFGSKIVHEFVAKHNLDLVARAHMVVEGGS